MPKAGKAMAKSGAVPQAANERGDLCDNTDIMRFENHLPALIERATFVALSA